MLYQLSLLLSLCSPVRVLAGTSFSGLAAPVSGEQQPSEHCDDNPLLTHNGPTESQPDQTAWGAQYSWGGLGQHQALLLLQGPRAPLPALLQTPGPGQDPQSGQEGQIQTVLQGLPPSLQLQLLQPVQPALPSRPAPAPPSAPHILHHLPHLQHRSVTQ